MSAVTEKHQALGSFQIDLSPDTPRSIVDTVDYFEHILITKTWVDVGRLGPEGVLYPSSGTFPGSTTVPGNTRPLLDQAAVYGGVIRKRPRGEKMTIEGVSTLVWLGDEDDKGDVIEASITLTNASLETAISGLLPLAVKKGAIHAQGDTRYTGSHIHESRRKAIEYVCDYFDVEFRVNPNATIDAGKADELYGGGDLIYPSASTHPGASVFPAAVIPTAIAVRKGAGGDPNLTGLPVASLANDEDVEDYTTRVLLLAETQGGGAIATGAAEVATVPFLDLHGNPVKRTRMVFESGTSTGNATRRAHLQLNRFTSARQQVSISLDDFEVDGEAAVGRWIYVYDPEAGLFNPGVEEQFRGRRIQPLALRVLGATWPIAPEMGVYWRDKWGAYTDLTDYVVKSTGATRLDVGATRRTLIDREAQREALRARVV